MEPKYSINSAIKLLEDNILKDDVIQAAIFYLREYEEKKDELDELIKKETLKTHNSVRMARVLTEMIEEKANDNE